MELIRKYLEEEKKMSSVILERTIAKIERHTDIAEEFKFWIETKEYKTDTPLRIEGYTAEEIFKTGDNAALDAYLHEYEVYAEDGYEKYTERVDIYDRYSHFIEDVMDLREKSDWESDKTPRAYEVEDILYYAHEILLQDDYRISEIEFQENQKYFSEIQQNTIATLMGTLEMTEEEVNEFVKCDRYYDEEETFVKIIFERKGWEYEEN